MKFVIHTGIAIVLVGGVAIFLRGLAPASENPTVDVRASVLESLTTKGELTTATAVYTTPVDSSQCRQTQLGCIPGSSTRLTYIATTKVDAGVDLSLLSEDDVSIAPDGTMTITLPAPEILDAAIDNDNSYVATVNRGAILSPDSAPQTDAARKEAVDDAKIRACNSDLLAIAAESAEETVKSMLNLAGIENVIVTSDRPEVCGDGDRTAYIQELDQLPVLEF